MHAVQVRVGPRLPWALLMIVLVVGNAQAADRFVSTTGSDAANDCLTSTSPCGTLGYALTQAASGDTVKVAGGTYRENLTINTAMTLTLSGGWATDFGIQDPVTMRTVLWAALKLPVLAALAAGVAIDLTIDGLTLKRGQNFTSSGPCHVGEFLAGR